MAGNRLGSKTKVTYTSDSGALYNMTIDIDLVMVGAGFLAGHIGQPAPKRFKPRVIHVQQPIGVGRMARKKLIVGDVNSAMWITNAPADYVIDGETFTSTGRRGEVQTY